MHRMQSRRKVYTKGKKRHHRREYGSSRSRMIALPRLTKAVDQYVLPGAAGTATSLSLNSTVAYTLLNAIQNGSGPTQRIGSKIKLAGVQLRLALKTLRSSTDLQEAWRVIIVYDRQPNGAAPTVSTLTGGLDYAGSEIQADGIFDMIHPSNRDRYIVLYDKTVRPRYMSTTAGPVAPVSAVAGDQQYMLINKFVKIPGFPTVYGASSTPPVVGDIRTGSLYVITMGNVASGSETQCLYGSMRTFYHDDPY